MTSKRQDEISTVVGDIRSLRDTVEQLTAQSRITIGRFEKQTEEILTGKTE